jgi:hypothetical protein
VRRLIEEGEARIARGDVWPLCWSTSDYNLLALPQALPDVEPIGAVTRLLAIKSDMRIWLARPSVFLQQRLSEQQRVGSQEKARAQGHSPGRPTLP